LSLLASQAAVALQNAQLFSEAQRLSRDLQTSLEELKKAQALLIQSEKLSALGELIAGVAHELNNPLTAVMGYAQLLQGAQGISERMERDLRKIHLQAQRAARIVRSMLTFARQHRPEQRCVEVNSVLEQVLELRSYQLRVNNIRLVTDLGDEPLEVLADVNQLQQVFLNLINNAQDAIVDGPGKGQLAVTSRRVADVVRLEFADNGPGIPAEHMGNLFSPFFTTKDIGKGTGLGLSICYGIVRQHRGRIWAESEAGHGATLIVELPVSPRETEARAEMATPQPLETLVTGRLLVVDDEEEVTELLYRLLSDDGHEVEAALSGQTALEKILEAEASGNGYDLIVCDIKMPGIDGPRLYHEVRVRYPALAGRMIFFTGDTINLETHAFLERTGNRHVAKPFVVEELRKVVAEMLEGHVLQEPEADDS
jgi:two-component system NtrC family sensor kinase